MSIGNCRLYCYNSKGDPVENYHLDICLPGNYPRRQLPQENLPPLPPRLLSPGQLPRTGSYLGQMTSRKRVAAQNWKRPNRGIKSLKSRNNWSRLNMF